MPDDKPLGDLRSIVGHLPSFILEIDGEGIIRYLNRDGPSRTREQIIGTRAADHLGDQHEMFEGAFMRARETGEAQSYEVSVYGRLYTVWLQPVFIGDRMDRATLIATDVTELRRLVQALAASEQKTRAVLRALPDLVFAITRDGVYLDFKAERELDLAAAPDAIVGRRIQETLPGEVADRCLAAIAKALDSGEMQVFEYQLALPHGLQDFEARVVATGDDEVAFLCRNMTDRKRIEQRLSAADRLVSLGTLVAGVAHEMNNPLSYVLLNLASADRMLASWQAGESPNEHALGDVRSRLAKSVEGAKRMQQIVKNLMTFSHGGREHVATVDVGSLLDWAIGMVAGELEDRAVIQRHCDEALRVAANRDSLSQVFVNLLLNAAQALPERPMDENSVTIIARKEGKKVAIDITDTGEGIEPADRARIFEPFFTTKPVGVGTGLGLWICHSIVTGIGGTIDVESTPGSGTTVRVVLPAAD